MISKNWLILSLNYPPAGNIQKIIIDSDGKGKHIVMELADAQTLAPGMSRETKKRWEFLVTDDEVKHE